MKEDCEPQKRKENEVKGKKEEEKTSQDLIEEILIESQRNEALVNEEKEKTLEDLIEEILEEELSVDVDVKRRGPFLWISRGSNIHSFARLLEFTIFRISPSSKCSKFQPAV